jgi:hypothetical protein
MQLPALQIRQPDLGNALYKAAVIKSMGTRNKLAEAKLAREGKVADLSGQAMADMTGPRNALAARAADPGIGEDVDAMGAEPGRSADAIPESLRALAAIAPDRAQKIVDLTGKLNDRQKETAKENSARAAKLAIGVLDAPDAQKPAAYAQALQIAGQNGYPVDTLPPEWGPEAQQSLNTVVLEALSFDDILKMRKDEPKIIEIFDDKTGRKQKGYMQAGKFVPVGGTAAEDIDGAKDPARVREANWLVENKIFPNLKAAYEATRTRVGMSGADVRTKGLTWVSSQKDRFSRQVYDSPEKQAAALAAYEKFVAGDTEGALKDLQSIAPKEEAAKPGFIERTVKSLFGSTDKPPESEAKPAAKPAADITDRVKQKYKAIAPYDLSVIDSRSKGISEGRKLEFYTPDQEDNPTPGRPTVEVFDPSFKGDDLTDMVAADFLHYLGKNDPKLVELREQFRKSLTPEQQETDRRAYELAGKGEHGGPPETRPYEKWFDVHRLDQYLGSMFLPKGSENRKEWVRAMTPDQKEILGNIKTYLEQGSPAEKPKGETRKAPDGKDYPVVSDKAAYDKVPAGSVYWHAGKKQFVTKGQK